MTRFFQEIGAQLTAVTDEHWAETVLHIQEQPPENQYDVSTSGEETPFEGIVRIAADEGGLLTADDRYGAKLQNSEPTIIVDPRVHPHVLTIKKDDILQLVERTGQPKYTADRIDQEGVARVKITLVKSP